MIALVLAVLSIIDLVTGTSSVSIWVGVVCGPIVFITSVYQIVRVRRTE
ncbi:MAG: hypothetical protein WDA07_14060 [Leucobacter sp.]